MVQRTIYCKTSVREVDHVSEARVHQGGSVARFLREGGECLVPIRGGFVPAAGEGPPGFSEAVANFSHPECRIRSGCGRQILERCKGARLLKDFGRSPRRASRIYSRHYGRSRARFGERTRYQAGGSDER